MTRDGMARVRAARTTWARALLTHHFAALRARRVHVLHDTVYMVPTGAVEVISGTYRGLPMRRIDRQDRSRAQASVLLRIRLLLLLHILSFLSFPCHLLRSKVAKFCFCSCMSRERLILRRPGRREYVSAQSSPASPLSTPSLFPEGWLLLLRRSHVLVGSGERHLYRLGNLRLPGLQLHLARRAAHEGQETGGSPCLLTPMPAPRGRQARQQRREDQRPHSFMPSFKLRRFCQKECNFQRVPFEALYVFYSLQHQK
jgi:hypothetical protein